MEKIKKALRLLLIVLLIFLASLGIGLTGAPPTLPKSSPRRDQEKAKTELVDSDQQEKKGVRE